MTEGLGYAMALVSESSGGEISESKHHNLRATLLRVSLRNPTQLLPAPASMPSLLVSETLCSCVPKGIGYK